MLFKKGKENTGCICEFALTRLGPTTFFIFSEATISMFVVYPSRPTLKFVSRLALFKLNYVF
jgi:hypothetical protein